MIRYQNTKLEFLARITRNVYNLLQIKNLRNKKKHPLWDAFL
jgi:hypothetical protein